MPARYSKMFQMSSGFDANDLFGHAGVMHAKCGGDRGTANVGADFEDISRAEPGKVIDEKQHIHVQHGCGAADFFKPMAYLMTAIFHELVHQLEHLAGMRRVGQSRIGLRNHGPILLTRNDSASCGDTHMPRHASKFGLLHRYSMPRKTESLAMQRKIREVRTRATLALQI